MKLMRFSPSKPAYAQYLQTAKVVSASDNHSQARRRPPRTLCERRHLEPALERVERDLGQDLPHVPVPLVEPVVERPVHAVVHCELDAGRKVEAADLNAGKVGADERDVLGASRRGRRRVVDDAVLRRRRGETLADEADTGVARLERVLVLRVQFAGRGRDIGRVVLSKQRLEATPTSGRSGPERTTWT